MASAFKVHGLTLATSVGFHAVVAGLVSWIAIRSLQGEDHRARIAEGASGGRAESPLLSVELPSVGEGILVEDERVDPVGEPPRPTGGDPIAYLDNETAGRGGDARVMAAALNLADEDEHMRLSPDPVSRLDRDQLQRLCAARVRQSWEDRRSTTHPSELTLLVTGTGAVLERRAPSQKEPSRGVLQSTAPSVHGANIGAGPASDEAESERKRGGAQLGTIDAAPGLGIPNALIGVDHRASAPIGSARPDVAQAPVAVPAVDPARPRDDIDSDQQVATTVRSLVHASTAGGLPGMGQGGSGAGGMAAAGGVRGAGSRARPLGFGDDDVFDFWTSDPRLLPYFRRIHAKIDPLWAHAFPKSALLELKQGTVILEFTVAADGRTVVSWPPVRPSGVDEFDRNCAEAIRRASPLPPIPAELGMRSVRIRAPFVANNPVIK